MKLILLFLTFFSVSAFSTGIKTNVFQCSSIVNGPSWSLDHFSTSAPRGPVTEWYELKYQENGNPTSFRLQQDELDQDGNSTLASYSSQEPNGYGKLHLLRIAGKIFIDVRLGNTFNGVQAKTNGLIELGDGYFCN